jgi:hypothetical protein
LPEGTEENHAEDFNQDSPSVYKLEAWPREPICFVTSVFFNKRQDDKIKRNDMARACSTQYFAQKTCREDAS